MKNLYDEEYYERGIESGMSCYTNYRWIPELTIPMAARIIEYLGIRDTETILDFGCAKGYLVRSLRLLHRTAYGFDISDYAISKVPEEVKPFILTKIDGFFHWIISKDVFEHIDYDEIDGWLRLLAEHCDNMFVVVPLGSNGKYVIPAYELDKTHVIREDLSWWEHTFEKSGFQIVESNYSVKYIKSNWDMWEKGNGFFVLKSDCGRMTDDVQ